MAENLPNAAETPDGPKAAHTLSIQAIEPLPDVREGDDLGALICARCEPRVGDVLVISHKVVSKSEGALLRLGDVRPSPRATELAATHGKDPRVVEVVLRESAAVVRAHEGVLICRTHHGFVCANAGVDASNVAEGWVALLPRDPDASARRLRASLPQPAAVVIADSFGRAWRHGQCDVAIGIAGLAPLDDWAGRGDAFGRRLRVTSIAIADQVAAAADLVRRKDSRQPVVLVRGLSQHVTAADGPGARALVRSPEEDLFG